MPRSHRWWAGFILFALGCNPPTPTSPNPSGSSADPVPGSVVIPGAMVGSTWPVSMADDTLRAPFESHPGWVAFVMQRDYPAALAAFGGDAPLAGGQARVHLELAAAYRQALLIGAHATIQVYGENRRDEDPPAVDCLLVVSYALAGLDDPQAGRLEACSASVITDLVDHARAWDDWAGTDVWPPTAALAATPGQPGEAVIGSLPDAGTLPHWRAKDRVEGLELQAASPAGLLALALFHEQAAIAALPESEQASVALLAPWRLPSEPVALSADIPEVPAELLFGSAMLVPADVAFMADVDRGGGVAAVAGWRDRSALASAISPCVDAAVPAVDVPCAIEASGRGFDQMRTAMEIRSGGEQGYHRPFAELGRVGVIRAAEAVASITGDEKATGLLRLEALDRAVGTSAEPHYLLSIAAWDAGNRNSSRASDSLHAQVGHIPGVEVARFPLDALHVRLSRESAPGVPMH